MEKFSKNGARICVTYQCYFVVSEKHLGPVIPDAPITHHTWTFTSHNNSPEWTRIFCGTVHVILSVHVSSVSKPSITPEYECGFDLSSAHPLQVPILKIHCCFTVWIMDFVNYNYQMWPQIQYCCWIFGAGTETRKVHQIHTFFPQKMSFAGTVIV
jgi:hypothetical protein